MGKKNQAKNITVFKSIAGMLDHKLEEQHFVEMGFHIPILISIILEDEKPLLSALKEEGISLFLTLLKKIPKKLPKKRRIKF